MKKYLIPLLLPLLAAAYPILFIYGNNAWALEPGSLVFPMVVSLAVAAAGYGLFLVLFDKPDSAALGTLVLLLLFYGYGFLYRRLVDPDAFTVHHFVLLPVLLVAVGYIGYGLAHLKESTAASLRKILLIVAAGLVILNTVIILPVAFRKGQMAAASAIPVTGAASTTNGQRHPDIYYIIFDEYVRFDAMREYWKNNDVDQFEAFLRQHGFFLGMKSTSPTINTQVEMASRLNLHNYTEADDTSVTLTALNQNKVMKILKSYGYTTYSLNMAFPDIQADYNLKYDPTQVSGMAADEFRRMYLEDTALDAFSGYFQDTDVSGARQKQMILSTLAQTVNPPGNPTGPKFVYAHLLLPHEPFIFDKNGNILPGQNADDWHNYLGNYQWATKLAQQVTQQILAKADPANPPIIILQSDEGARNLQRRSTDKIILNGYLENYPAQYSQEILNAMYLPGYDISTLPQDLAPVQTFAIVLNHYLNANVSVDK